MFFLCSAISSNQHGVSFKQSKEPIKDRDEAKRLSAIVETIHDISTCTCHVQLANDLYWTKQSLSSNTMWSIDKHTYRYLEIVSCRAVNTRQNASGKCGSRPNISTCKSSITLQGNFSSFSFLDLVLRAILHQMMQVVLEKYRSRDTFSSR